MPRAHFSRARVYILPHPAPLVKWFFDFFLRGCFLAFLAYMIQVHYMSPDFLPFLAFQGRSACPVFLCTLPISMLLLYHKFSVLSNCIQSAYFRHFDDLQPFVLPHFVTLSVLQVRAFILAFAYKAVYSYLIFTPGTRPPRLLIVNFL